MKNEQELTLKEGRGTVAAGTTSEKTKSHAVLTGLMQYYWTHAVLTGGIIWVEQRGTRDRPEGEVGQITICHVGFIL